MIVAVSKAEIWPTSSAKIKKYYEPGVAAAEIDREVFLRLVFSHSETGRDFPPPTENGTSGADWKTVRFCIGRLKIGLFLWPRRRHQKEGRSPPGVKGTEAPRYADKPESSSRSTRLYPGDALGGQRNCACTNSTTRSPPARSQVHAVDTITWN